MRNHTVRRWAAFILTALFVLTLAFQEGIPVHADGSGTSGIPESRKLEDFMTDVAIVGPSTGDDGTITVEADKAYDIKLSFAEGEKLQFADSSDDLVYSIPKDITLTVPPDGAYFPIHLSDDQGKVDIAGNTCRIEGGKLYVRANGNDPNYQRLKNAGNIQFSLKLKASLSGAGQTKKVQFSNAISRTFQVINAVSALKVEKTGSYVSADDTVKYTVKVTSTGKNTNVNVHDEISGTALSYSKGSLSGEFSTGKSVSFSSTKENGNGFTAVIPSMEDGETAEITYSAKVNFENLTNNNAEQTGNKVAVKSDESTETSADYSAQVPIPQPLTKTAGAVQKQDDGTSLIPWTIVENGSAKISVHGRTITDVIPSDSAQYMDFTGDGVQILVKDVSGKTVDTRTVSWKDLGKTNGTDGSITWKYVIPDNDTGNYSYTFTYNTKADPKTSIQDLTLSNKASDEKTEASASAAIRASVGTRFDIEKKAVQFNTKTADYQVNVKVPSTGASSLVLTDTPFSAWISNQHYFDLLQADSLKIDGLLKGEDFALEPNPNKDTNAFVIRFYKTDDAGKKTEGLLPSGAARTLTITYTVDLNQDIVKAAATDSSLITHTNYISAVVNDNVRKDSSSQISVVPGSLSKKAESAGSVQIDGKQYPLFRYTVIVKGVSQDSVEISDTFATDKLQYYNAEYHTPEAYGGNTNIYYPSDQKVTVVADKTDSGLKFTLSNLKDADGKYFAAYRLEYYLVGTDALNKASFDRGRENGDGTITLTNTASWDQAAADATADTTYSYQTLDKQETVAPSKENGYKSTFQLVVNPDGEDLLEGADELELTDVMSENLRFVEDSLKVIVGGEPVSYKGSYDAYSHTLKLTVPDGKKVIVQYDAYVIGTGDVSYSNTASLEGYKKGAEKTVKVDKDSDAGGTASVPHLVIRKIDAEDISQTLPGAVFQLFDVKNGTETPVTTNNDQPVTVTTGADGTAVLRGNLSEEGWTLWEDHTYHLREIQAPDGYQVSNSVISFHIPSSGIRDTDEAHLSGDIINVADNKLTHKTIRVRKVWADNNDQDKIRPASVEAQLVTVNADGRESASYGDPVELNSTNGWEYTWENLDPAKIYSVKEVKVPEGYSASLSGTEEDGFVLTNTHTLKPRTSVSVEKKWDDDNNRDGIRPEEVTVSLMANGEATGKPVELSKANNWKYEWTDLLKNGSDGKAIEYSVRETSVDGYTAEITGNAQNGFTITNKHVPAETKITVTKTWKDGDNKDQIRPESVQVQILADGKAVKGHEDPVVLDSANNWKYTWDNLAAKADGKDITYTVKEVLVPDGYSVSLSGTEKDGFVLTNTHTLQPRTSVSVEKKWDDDNNRDGIRPEEVTVNLLANGEETGKSVKLNEANNWKYEWTDLLKEGSDGKNIKYSVKEETVKDYTSEVSKALLSNKFTITNTHIVETPTVPTTETPTVPTTEKPTVPTTETPTVPTTEKPTVPTTETPTVPTTEKPTVPTTETPTVPTTETPTVPTTETPTVPTTEKPTETPTVPTTETPTVPTTETSTIPMTETTTALNGSTTATTSVTEEASTLTESAAITTGGMSETSETVISQGTVPSTGDNSHMGLFGLIMAVCAGSITVNLALRRQSREKK